MLSFKFADTFFSFFKSRPPMDEQATILLNKNSTTLTAMFLLGLRGWWSEFCHSNPDPTLFLSQIRVTCIMHNKMPLSPEHEFLIIETQDREGTKTPLILERTVGLQRETGETDRINDISPDGLNRLYKKIKRIASDALTSGNKLGSMEEETIRRTLTLMDRFTMSTTQSADLLSESLNLKIDEIHDSSAIDHFLGENFVFSSNWHGQNIRYFKPRKTLSLFQFAVLADVVSKSFPKYTLLREQCYFFAGLVYSAVEYEYGIGSSSSGLLNEDQDLVQIDDSRLSNRFGRYKGALVSDVDRQEVVDIVEKFRDAYASEIGKVNITIFQITSILTTTFFIDHEIKAIFNYDNYDNHDDDDDHNDRILLKLEGC